jgi:thymidylate synthase ThyX
MPDVFYQTGEGMQSSKQPIEQQRKAQALWEATWKFCESAAYELEKLNVSKEQRNRVLPTFGMIRSLMTATEDGWKRLLALRLNPAADVAMQEFSFFIQRGLHNLEWTESIFHVPYWDLERAPTSFDIDDDFFRICMARIARISYNREGKGKRDLELGTQLLAAGHWSPAEHIALWKETPQPSALCSKPEDTYNGAGWENYRAFLGA